jgi:CDP-paratose 2-epimerase
MIAELGGERPVVKYDAWRAADQRWYVSDTRKIERTLSWRPTVGVAEGVRRLHSWLRAEERPAPTQATEVHV